MLVMATMMVPGEATIISNYLTVGSLGLLDTYIVLILPSLTSAMGIFPSAVLHDFSGFSL